jgi:hypothetical protein
MAQRFLNSLQYKREVSHPLLLPQTDLQLKHAIKQIIQPQSIFLGVFSRNSLPHLSNNYFYSSSRMTRAFFLIINSDPKNLSGKHWITVWIGSADCVTGRRRAEYFDSLGLLPIPSVVQWLKRICCSWTYCAAPVQMTYSTHCGAFVLFFLFLKMLAHSNREQFSLRNFYCFLLEGGGVVSAVLLNCGRLQTKFLNKYICDRHEKSWFFSW